jgi:hypothetical protein
VGRHRIAHRPCFSPLGQLLLAVLHQRLELREAELVAVGDGDDERLVDEGLDEVGDLLGREVVGGAHELGRRQVAPAGEHREALEDALFVVEEELVAPVDDGTQGLLPR